MNEARGTGVGCRDRLSCLPKTAVYGEDIMCPQAAVLVVEYRVVDVDDGLDIDGDPGFLHDFPGGSVAGGFARLDMSAGQAPGAGEAPLAALDYEYLVAAKNGCTCRGTGPLGCRCGRHGAG